MQVADFDFELPESQIAQEPRPRGQSRLLVVHRASSTWEERSFGELAPLLSPGDVLIGNDTRVFPARLIGRRDPSGGAVECMLLERESEAEWQALVHPGQKLKPGSRVVFEDPSRAPGVCIKGVVLERRFFGRRLMRFETSGAASFDAAVDAIGHVPLPPYIKRTDTYEDRDRYQTVFARDRGSVAAPTAGLHFDDSTLTAIDRRGVRWATITLHVGYGTFKPIRSAQVEDHVVDQERYAIPENTADLIRRARVSRNRVIAVGTTTTRALESAANDDRTVAAGPGTAHLFIFPGHRFRVVDGLLTNFHLPKSSLLMLVSAFAGRELTLAAYRHAVTAGFRFYSYGDAMLIL